MCEQTRQQIAADLEYALKQLTRARVADQHGSARCPAHPAAVDAIDRAYDALERIKSYLERADGPATEVRARIRCSIGGTPEDTGCDAE